MPVVIGDIDYGISNVRKLFIRS